MKKLLILFAFLYSTAFAQTSLTIPIAGSIQITTPDNNISVYSTAELFYQYSTNKLFLFRNGVTTPVANNSFNQYRTDGTTPTSMNDLLAYLQANRVAAAPAASGGGGGGSGTSNTTEATQLLVKNAVQSIDGKTPTLGQKVSSGSQSVVLASDQGAISVNNTPIYALTTRVSAAVTVGTTSTLLTSANVAGYMVFIQNNGSNDVWISIGGTASLAPPSILLKGGGGQYTSFAVKPEVQSITAISSTPTPITIITF